MDTTNYDLIYEIIILIFFIIAFITSLYMIYLKSKAWHKLNLESRKEVAASTVEFVAKPGIEREVVMINASRFIAAIVLLLSWAFFTSEVVILFIGNLIFIVTLLAEMYMNADLTKKARKHYTSIPYIYNAKRAKLVKRLYIICRISYMIVAVACTFLIYSVFGW